MDTAKPPDYYEGIHRRGRAVQAVVETHRVLSVRRAAYDREEFGPLELGEGS